MIILKHNYYYYYVMSRSISVTCLQILAKYNSSYNVPCSSSSCVDSWNIRPSFTAPSGYNTQLHSQCIINNGSGPSHSSLLRQNAVGHLKFNTVNTCYYHIRLILVTTLNVSFKKAQRPIINDFLHYQTVDQCSDIQRTEFCQNNQKPTSVLSLMKTQDEKQKY